MNKSVRYGDQVYIEISNLLPFPNTDTRLLYSNSFLDESVFGVKAQDYRRANFRNCIFTITPNLVDSKEDVNMLNSLKVELSFLSRSKPDTLGEKCLRQEIHDKEKQIETNKEGLATLNKKILDEMDGRNVCYGDIVLLQHLESGYYLCAESSYHPNNPSLHNLRLRKGRTPACYFKFFSYLAAHDRDIIDYGSEMKLASVIPFFMAHPREDSERVMMNTVVSMGEMKKTLDMVEFNKEDDEKEADIEKPRFAADALRRENIFGGEEGKPLVIGTSLDSNDNNRIRLAEYCSRENLVIFNKKKVIKNGDYIRLQLDEFYLTGSKNIHRHDLGLYEQKADDYRYNLINTIFQVVREEQRSEYPRGQEIQSTPKRGDANGEQDVERFYLKHFVTGNYLSGPKESLYEVKSGEDEGFNFAENLPTFQFVNSHLNHRYSLTRNSRVSLKAFSRKNQGGEFFVESEVEKHNIQQSDLNSKFFIGFKNSEDKIRSKLQLSKKEISGNEAVGSFFRISGVNEEEMRTILEFESYANALQRFMRVLQCSLRKHEKISLGVFEDELARILRASEKLLGAIKSHDVQAQILVREYKIVDITARFLYYFFVEPEIGALLEEDWKGEREDIVKLLKNFCNVILNSSRENDLSHVYSSQYIRVFIHSLLNPSALFSVCNALESQSLKGSIIILLYTFLWEKDLDTFGQLVYYEEPLFAKLDEQQDYSVHLLQLMTHYFTKKSPNLINTLLENFIQNYIGSEERLAKIFPKIGTLEWDQEFELDFVRANYDQKIKLSSAPPEVIHYLVWVFKLISATAKSSKSLKFWSIIMNFYSEELCENLLSSPTVPPMVKNGVLSVVRYVHIAYRELPFDIIPPKIQILLENEDIENWQKKFDNMIEENESMLIGNEESQIVKTMRSQVANQEEIKKLKHHKTGGIDLSELAPEILKEGLEDIEKGDLTSLPLTLQIMVSLLEEGDLDIDIICSIHHSLAILLKKLAEKLSMNKESEEEDAYIAACTKAQDRIFYLLHEVERCTVKLAFQETVKSLKNQVLKDYKDVNYQNKESLILEKKDGISVILDGIVREWRSKKKLYREAKAIYFKEYLGEQVMESLWKIVGDNEEGELANNTIALIKTMTNFEKKVMKELSECVLIAENTDLLCFNELAENLLKLNKIHRRIKVQQEFGLTERENKEVLEQVLKCLEEIFLTIYDYEQHMQEEDQGLDKTNLKKVFMKRYLFSKVKAKTELPFRYKTNCVKTVYQKILRVLGAHEVILPFIKIFMENEQKLGYSLVITIVTLFMHKNKENQLLLSNEPKFVTLFYDDKVLNGSIDGIFMFVEMCRENKKLLKLKRDYLFNVVAYDFIEFYGKFAKNFENPAALNYIRSLHIIFSANIPKEMFDPAHFMMETLFNFMEFMAAEKKISLMKLLQDEKNILKRPLEVHESLTLIDVPIFYTILKELLQSQKIFALTREKERVLVLQSSFTLEKVEPLLKNENIEFNFELKQLALETFENIYLKSTYQNTNIFEDYEHFASFTSLLFIDIYGYLCGNGMNNPEIFEENKNLFGTEENLIYLEKYYKLLKTKDVNSLVFFQYQSLMQVRQLWKNYIYFLLCDFFGHLITHFKDFMLLKNRQQSENIFEIWLKLITKVREIDAFPESRSRLNQAMKNAVSHSEYVYKRDLVHTLLENNLIISSSAFKRGLSKQKTTVKLHVDTILQRYLGDQDKLKTKYLEGNLAKIAIDLGLKKSVLKRLISLLLTTETSTKDVVFILRLFRNFIEVENKANMQVRQPVYQWLDVSEGEFKKIHEVQEILADLGLVEAVFHLFYHHPNQEKAVFRELLLLCIALLYGGNRVVQDEFYEEFRQDYDNEILSNFAFILEENLELMRARESERTEEAYFKALQHIFDQLEFSNNGGDSIGYIPENLKKDLANDFYQDEENLPTIESNDLLLIILEFLQTLCEGHYLNFQEFLRDQTIVDHAKSFNIPEFLRQAYHVYYKYHNIHNIETGVKILDLLIEIQQGESQENIDLMLKKTFINDLCNTLNRFNTNLDLLARGFSFDSSHPTLMEIKSKVLIILKDLVEKSEPASLIKIAQYVDLKALVSTFKENIIAFHKKKGICPGKYTLRPEDMWDPNLSCAFMVYFILRHLSFDEPSEDFTEEISDMFKEVLENGQGMDSKLANRYLNQFFKQFTGSIEILQKKTNKLMRIYYPVPVVCSYLKDEAQNDFANKVDRSNTLTKIADLMDSSVEIIGQMHIEYNSQHSVLGLNFNKLYAWIRFFTNCIAVFIVIFDIARLDYKDEKVFYKGGEEDILIKSLLCVFQIIFAFFLTLLWTKIALSRHLAFKWDQFVSANVHDMGELPQDYIQKLNKPELITPEIAEAVLLLKGPYSAEWAAAEPLMKNRLKKYNMRFICQSGMLFWHVLYLVICLGSSFHPIIAALQLFDIIIRSDTVSRIVMAISRNLNQFLWTLILLFVTVYVYSLAGLYFMNSRFQDGDIGPLCQDAYSCLLASLNYGLRSGGGIADALQKYKYDEENKWEYLVNTLFDLSFFIIIVTLLLNLIFGMIIDAFGDLRDEKSSNEEDMENVCFICGLQRSEYERTDNFEKHISKEHNMWKYLAYLVYLQEKSKLYATDFTDIEDYVLDRYQNKDYMWIPVGRSLTLERHLAKGEKEKKSEIEKLKADMEMRFEKLMEQNKYLISRIEQQGNANNGGGKVDNHQQQHRNSMTRPLQKSIKSQGKN